MNKLQNNFFFDDLRIKKISCVNRDWEEMQGYKEKILVEPEI